MTRRGANGYLSSGPTPGVNGYFRISDMDYYFFNGDYHILHSDTAGNLRKDFLTPVLINIPTWDGKFQMVQNGEFIFILPSLESANLLIWHPSWSAAREAGALAPVGTAIVAVNGSAVPNVPIAADWIFGVVFETDSAFFTKIGPFNAGVKTLTKFTSSGAHGIDLSNIPTGPANTVARHIVVSRPFAPSTFDGNFDAHELFFMPGTTGKIADNVTTTLSINSLYELDLVRSADYLHERLERIPNARGITILGDRLVLFGDKDDRNAIRVSKLADLEGFNSVDGVITTPVKSEEGVYGVAELRGTYYVFKEGATIAYEDTSEFPAEWEFVIVDRARTVINVAEVSRDVHGVEDYLFVVTEGGQLWIFNGIYQADLSYFVPGLIDNAVQTLIFAEEKYVLIRNTDNHVLFMDFSEGLTESAVKWSRLGYTAPGTLLKILAQPLEFAGIAGNVAPEFVYEAKVLRGHPTAVNGNTEGDQFSNPPLTNPLSTLDIEWIVRFPPVGGPHGIYHWGGMQLRIRSENANAVTLIPSIKKRDNGVLEPVRNISVTKGRSYYRLLNVRSETIALDLTGNALLGDAVGQFVEIEEVTLFGKLLWIRRYGSV